MLRLDYQTIACAYGSSISVVCIDDLQPIKQEIILANLFIGQRGINPLSKPVNSSLQPSSTIKMQANGHITKLHLMNQGRHIAALASSEIRVWDWRTQKVLHTVAIATTSLTILLNPNLYVTLEGLKNHTYKTVLESDAKPNLKSQMTSNYVAWSKSKVIFW